MNIYLCPSPDLYHLYHRDGAAVIITDIFRATTTIATAMANGALGILPVATTDEAESIGKHKGDLIAAERQVRKCAFADLGNDPLEYSPDIVSGRRIVLTTTNGTRSLRIALEAGAKHILIGAFINLPQTIAYCHKAQLSDIVVVAAGWQGQISAEDCLYAGALAALAEKDGYGTAQGDAAVMMRDIWLHYCQSDTDRLNYIRHSEHYTRLVEAGHANAVAYCMTIGSHDIVVGITDEEEGWLRAL